MRINDVDLADPRTFLGGPPHFAFLRREHGALPGGRKRQLKSA